MVVAKQYKCIDFVRIMNLLGLHNDSQITKERFISLLEPSREKLECVYGDPNFDANACIKNDPDYKMTYDGYAKFLKKDLAHGVIRSSVQSGKKYKAKIHETAKAMIARGVVSSSIFLTNLFRMLIERYPGIFETHSREVSRACAPLDSSIHRTD